MKCECEEKQCFDFYQDGEKKCLVRDKSGTKVENTTVRQCEKFRMKLREFLNEDGVQRMSKD